MATPLIKEQFYPITENDANKLYKYFTASEVDNFIHDSDNSMVACQYGKTCQQLKNNNKEIVGICYQTSHCHNGQSCAVCFYDYNDNAIHWVHISDKIILAWEKEAFSE